MEVYLYETAEPRFVMTDREYNLLAENKIHINVHLRHAPTDRDLILDSEKRGPFDK
jgi:hypothetical protein